MVKIRPPIELPMHRENGCVTCVLAQILQVYGYLDAPDLYEIDRQANYRADDALSDRDAYRVLLRAGFIIYEFTDFHHELFVNRGLGYLVSYYGREWGDFHRAYFTTERIADEQERTRRFLETVRAYPGAYYPIRRRPEMSDVLTAFHNEMVVDVALPGVTPLQHHAVLLTPLSDNRRQLGWVYDPELEAQTVRPLRLQQFWPEVITGHGMALIRPR